MFNVLKKIRNNINTKIPSDISKINIGFCPICQKEVSFIKEADWLRDHYFCTQCRSIPRQRAIINALNIFSPEWKQKNIYESSPSGPSSEFIAKNAKEYIFSQYFPNYNSGDLVDWHGLKVMNQNLETLSFEDNSIDLIITQDVFEHIFSPEKAFKEISRVLTTCGIHIFTIPLYKELNRTRIRAEIRDGQIINHLEPVYHGNPVDKRGSLVTVDWGLDICDIIFKACGMTTTIYLCEDDSKGLKAEFLEVFISQKII